MEKFVKYTAYTIGVVLNLVIFCLVLSQLWTWFLVPIGFPVISAVNAYGLMLVMILFKTRNIRPLKKEFYVDQTTGLKIVIGLLFSLVALVFGFTASLFM